VDYDRNLARGIRPHGLRAVADTLLDATAGDSALIGAVADPLRRRTPEETLTAIHQYLKSSLKMIEPATWNHPARRRRTSVEIMEEGAWGCSAHAQVACHLARACGIPAILVKTLNVDWIERRNRGDGRGEGHVFVEVLVGDAVGLWDAQGGRLHVSEYDSYSPRFGDKLIYEKGGPEALILSHHGQVWEAETRQRFPVTRTVC
jgi:transglutaminase-like putative cysteine protease